MHNSRCHSLFHGLPALTALLLCVTASSCSPPEGIRTYTVETVSNRVSAPVSPHASGSAWFFKLQGPPDAVLAQSTAFEELVSSVRFSSDGQPAWDLPEGWTTGPGGGMRFATVTIGGTEPPLEVAVSSLTAADPAGDAYLRMNVERWRGQVGLPGYSGADWQKEARQSGELQEITSGDGPAYLVKLTGTAAEKPSAMLAAIIPRPGEIASPRSLSGAGPTDDVPLTYTAPSEWQATPLAQFQMLRFTVADGSQNVEISVSAVGGGLEMNLARWRDQVGLPDVSPAELAAAMQPIEIDGVPGQYVEFAGEKETIVGAIVPRGRMSLFFKLRGHKELAARETARFREFLKSVRFKE